MLLLLLGLGFGHDDNCLIGRLLKNNVYIIVALSLQMSKVESIIVAQHNLLSVELNLWIQVGHTHSLVQNCITIIILFNTVDCERR